MTAPSIVRVAGPDDYAEVWRLFLTGHAENGIFELAPQKVEHFVSRALWPERIDPMDTGPRGVIGVIGAPGALEALAFLVIGEVWYTRDKHVGDCFVFVAPDHRRSRHAMALLEWMKHQARLTALPLMSGVVSTERTEAKCVLYRRMFPKVGEVFLWHSS
jgi:GNAT superfamily N-acetyltransferase